MLHKPDHLVSFPSLGIIVFSVLLLILFPLLFGCNGGGGSDGDGDSNNLTYYMDADGDGFGDHSVSVEAEIQPSGYVLDNTDCDDTNQNINPSAAEIVDDSIDQDCDGSDLKTWYADSDMDGYGDLSSSTTSNTQPNEYVLDYSDCDDSDASINPGGAETPYNGKDDDCDVNTLDDDLDQDGYLNVNDCNDFDASVNPGATEICDDIQDNDCDEATDDIDSYCIINGDGGYFIAERYSWQSEDIVNRIVPIDFDNDNDIDIVLTPLNPNTIPQTFSKLMVLRNDGNANFTDASIEIFQNALWGNDNHYAVADFNGDGLMDLFLPESGPDLPGGGGGQSRIYTQNQYGQLIDETIDRLPIINLFTHYCAIGDIENDNDVDILMNNVAGDKVGSELYINDGNGYFTANTDRLPSDMTPPICPEGQNCTPAQAFNSSLFLDLDKDGDDDLVLGGGFWPYYRILLNDGSGNFSVAPASALPTRPIDTKCGPIEIVSSDFNADGWPDLILVVACGEDDGNALYLMYLINNQDGTFYDASVLIPDNDENNNFVQVADFNNDGYVDFISGHGSYEGNFDLNLYLNTGEGGFINKASLLPPERKRYFKTHNVGDFDNDGDTDIFLWSQQNGISQYHVISNLIPFSINVLQIEVPAPPTLISPQNNGTAGKSLTLKWNNDGVAKSYRFQVATDSNFSNIIINKGTIVSNLYTIDLPENQAFYWRVKGVNTGGAGEWSEIWSFTTENYTPTAIGISPSCIIDSSPAGTTVGNLFTEDPDRNDSHSYSFATGDGLNDADNGNFIINGNAVKTNTGIDYSSKSSFNIYVQTDDGFGGVFEQSLVIKVNPIGLVAYYPFNGNANDESRNMNHGIAVGPDLTADRFNKEDSAYSFNGIDDLVYLGTELNLINNANSLTIAAWVYPYEVSPSGTGRGYAIIGEGLGGDNYHFFIGDNVLMFLFNSNGIESAFAGSDQALIEANKWQFITVTYDGANVTFYNNAQPDTTTPASGNIDGNTSMLCIGSSDDISNFFNGKIDDLMIFNRALSDEEIKSLFESGI